VNRQRLLIMNAIGQTVYREEIAITEGRVVKEINFNNLLAQGMYFVKVITDESVYSQPVMYQR
jgi:hypothetical protein